MQLAWQEAALNCAEALAQTDRHHEATTLLRQVWELDNFDETILQAYMRHAYRGGHREAALRLYETFKEQLAREMEIEPLAETIALTEAITNNQPLTQQLETKRSKIILQQLEPLVGREHELAELGAMLEQPECRFLVMTGLGGVGKTRLALELLRQNIADYQHGSYFVSLAGITSPDLIIPAIAQALSFTFFGSKDPKEQLTDYLREKQLLLVIDNLEHVLEGAEVLLELLEAAPKLKLLVTSRHKPELPEVWSFALIGLPYETTSELSEAGRLFIQAAKRTQSRFSPTADDLDAIQTLGELVEGLPLAVELAAAWVSDLSPQEIVSEIQSNLDFLRHEGKGQQGSMRATFEHSWNLLSPEQQKVLAKLSVFRGGFTRQAAQQVAGATPYLLLSLLNRSLLSKLTAERYDFHELVRQYSDEKLDLPSRDEGREHHARYYASWMNAKGQQLEGSQQAMALQEMSKDIDNVRKTWAYLVEYSQNKQLKEMQPTLYEYYDCLSAFHEGRQAFMTAANALKKAKGSSSAEAFDVLAGLWVHQSWFSRALGHLEEAKSLLLQSRAHFEKRGHLQALSRCYTNLAAVSETLGDLEACKQYHEKALEIGQKILGPLECCDLLGNMSRIHSVLGNYQEAETYFTRARQIFEELNDYKGLAILHLNVGCMYLDIGELSKSEVHFQLSQGYAEKLDFKSVIASNFMNLAEVTFLKGDREQARVLREQSLKLFEEIRDKPNITFSTIMLGYDACRLGDLREARNYFEQALTLATELSATTLILDIFVGHAMIAQREQNYHRAYDLLEYVLQHPAISGEMKGRASTLKAEIEPYMQGQATPFSSIQEVINSILVIR